MTDFTSEHHAEMRLIGAGVLSGVNLLIKGDPGEAKTAKIESLAQKWGYYSETVVVSNREPQDFLGYPSPNTEENVMEYLPLRWAHSLNQHEKSLAIFDEFSLGSDCFAATLQVFAERRVGDIQLHGSVSALAIMNPVEVSVSGASLPAPVSNRFVHLDWKFDRREWLDNIVSGFENIETPSIEALLGFIPSHASIVRGRSLVRAFLESAPHHIKPGAPRDPEVAEKPWASPRTWTYLAELLGHLHPDDHEAITLAAQGAVGDGAAAEFVAYLRSHSLYDPYEAMDDPDSVDFTDSIDLVIALISSVEAITLADPKKYWTKGMGVMTACAASNRKDLALPFSRRILNIRPRDKRMPRAFGEHFGDLLEATGKVKMQESAT